MSGICWDGHFISPFSHLFSPHHANLSTAWGSEIHFCQAIHSHSPGPHGQSYSPPSPPSPPAGARTHARAGRIGVAARGQQGLTVPRRAGRGWDCADRHDPTCNARTTCLVPQKLGVGWNSPVIYIYIWIDMGYYIFYMLGLLYYQ